MQAAVQADALRIRFIRRVSHGAAANLIGQAVNIVGQLVQVPLLLAMWGTARYGEWLTLASVVAYLSLLDFGVQTYATNRMTQCRATGDQLQYLRVLQSAWALNLALACGGAALVLPALLLLPFDQWLQLHSTGHGAASITACLLALQTIAALPFGLVTGIYRTVNEYPREQMTNIARQTAVLVATVVTVSAGGGVAAVAAAQLGAIALPTLYAWHDLKRRHPAAAIGLRHASVSTALSFLHPSLLFLVLQLCGAAVIQGTTLIAGGVFGPAAVATFVTLRTLANLSQLGNHAVRNALWPEVAAMEATRDHHGLRQLHTLIAKISMATWLCATVVLHFEGGEVVRIWSRGRIPFDGAVLDCVLLLYGSYAFWETSSMLLGASNQHRTMTWLSASGSACGLGLAWVLTHSLGLPGLVLGVAAADIAIMAVFIPRLACRLISQRFRDFIAQVLGRGLLAALPVVTVAAAATRWLPMGSGMIRIISLSALTGLCCAASFWAIWLQQAERKRIASIARRALGV